MSVQATDIMGDGSLLYYSLDGTTYTAFAKIESIVGNKPKAAQVKTTTIDTPNNAETSQPGRVDYGEVSIRIKFQTAITTLILGWMTNKTIFYLKSQLADGTGPTTGSSDAVQAYVMDFDPFGELKENDLVVSSITFKVTGAATFVAST